jgi:trigger factor
MKTQVSELADNRVRLEIEVPAHDVDHAFEHALHDLSASVRIPGFRKGKAPTGMVARQIGREALVEEALRDHLTGWYSRAVAEIGIDPIDRPTIDWSDEPVEGSPCSFTAEVVVKPAPRSPSTRAWRACASRSKSRTRLSMPRSNDCA